MNLFQEYLSKIHRAEDFNVIVVGLSRLLNNPIEVFFFLVFSFFFSLNLTFYKFILDNKYLSSRISKINFNLSRTCYIYLEIPRVE